MPGVGDLEVVRAIDDGVHVVAAAAVAGDLLGSAPASAVSTRVVHGVVVRVAVADVNAAGAVHRDGADVATVTAGGDVFGLEALVHPTVAVVVDLVAPALLGARVGAGILVVAVLVYAEAVTIEIVVQSVLIAVVVGAVVGDLLDLGTDLIVGIVTVALVLGHPVTVVVDVVGVHQLTGVFDIGVGIGVGVSVRVRFPGSIHAGIFTLSEETVAATGQDGQTDERHDFSFRGSPNAVRSRRCQNDGGACSQDPCQEATLDPRVVVRLSCSTW